MVERYIRDVEVAGSNPVASISYAYRKCEKELCTKIICMMNGGGNVYGEVIGSNGADFI